MSDDPKSNAAPSAPEEIRTYAPGEVEVTRGREQGLGVGERDLQTQADPTGATTTAELRERTGTTAEDEAEGRKSDLPLTGV